MLLDLLTKSTCMCIRIQTYGFCSLYADAWVENTSNNDSWDFSFLLYRIRCVIYPVKQMAWLKNPPSCHPQVLCDAGFSLSFYLLSWFLLRLWLFLFQEAKTESCTMSHIEIYLQQILGVFRISLVWKQLGRKRQQERSFKYALWHYFATVYIV